MIFVTVSTGHFDPLIRHCNDLSDRFEFFGQVGMGHVEPNFKHVRTCTPEELARYMSEAELVVSHAGTGMLSTLYQLQRPAIVIPKQIRYGEANDGQVELAKKWGELDLGVLCMDIQDLEDSIERCRQKNFKFARRPSLGKAITESLGWKASSVSAA